MTQSSGALKDYAIDLKERIEARFPPDAYDFTFEFYPKLRKYASVVHNLPKVDPEWSLILGEIVFHLRSCLDHLAWQIAIFDDKCPGEHTYYPIRDSPYNKQGIEVPTQMVPAITSPVILDALEATQPYRTVEGTVDLAQGQRNALRAMRVLNNIDKHRLLVVTAAVLDADQMWWGLPENFPSPTVLLNPGVLEDDRPVAWFDFGPNEPPENFDPHPAVRISVREKEVAFLTLISLPEYMLALCDFWVSQRILDWRWRPIFVGEPPLF